VRASLELSGAKPAAMLRVSAKQGAGLEQLWQAVEACPLRRSQRATAGRDLLRLAQETLASRFAAAVAGRDAGLERLIAEWQKGTVSQPAAVEALLHYLQDSAGQGK
jgi:hypothetical protein